MARTNFKDSLSFYRLTRKAFDDPLESLGLIRQLIHRLFGVLSSDSKQGSRLAEATPGAVCF